MQPSAPTDISARSVPRFSQSIVPARAIGTPRAHMITSAVRKWLRMTNTTPARAAKNTARPPPRLLPDSPAAKIAPAAIEQRMKLATLNAWMYQR